MSLKYEPSSEPLHISAPYSPTLFAGALFYHALSADMARQTHELLAESFAGTLDSKP